MYIQVFQIFSSLKIVELISSLLLSFQIDTPVAGPGIESRWGARFSVPVQTGAEAHPASYKMGTTSLSPG